MAKKAANQDNEALYCICRKKYREGVFMIECDVCEDWFHGSCVSISETEGDDIDKFHCPSCTKAHGSTVYKPRRNNHRHAFSEDGAENKAVQAGTVAFVKWLKKRPFESADGIVKYMRGADVTVAKLEKQGFEHPIMVKEKKGLGLFVPPSDFAVTDVARHVESTRQVDVIDVNRQEDFKMSMPDWCDYFNTAPEKRERTLNVISLEFSDTQLSEFVEPPSVVQQIDWVQTCWPEHCQEPEQVNSSPNEDGTGKKPSRPKVQKYCLMSTQNSYTDFHVDFGGSSVWYHVLKGEKVFYLIRPTPENLEQYAQWHEEDAQSENFLGDLVDHCYECRVKPGATLLIPSGWIHAVLTPVDSLVFGGNFIHSFSIPLQLEINQLEMRLKVQDRHLFPHFEMLNWYAAVHITKQAEEYRKAGRDVPHYIQNGLAALHRGMRSWTQPDKIYFHRCEIPDSLAYSRVLRNMADEIKALGLSEGKTIAKSPRQPYQRTPSISTVTRSSEQRTVPTVPKTHTTFSEGGGGVSVTAAPPPPPA
eukprot:scpid71096/ scgid3858/ Lysine-specific demethylase 7; JmjC domain-containing histone demethylation protein 1D